MSRKLAESTVFVLLAKRRRRQLLRILRESSTPLRAIELAERIVEREYERPSVEDRQAVYLSLHHDHLPRLEEADVIAYRGDEGTVVPGLHFDSLVRVLEETNERGLAWSDE